MTVFFLYSGCIYIFAVLFFGVANSMVEYSAFKCD